MIVDQFVVLVIWISWITFILRLTFLTMGCDLFEDRIGRGLNHMLLLITWGIWQPRSWSKVLRILVTLICTRVMLLCSHFTVKTTIEFSWSFSNLVYRSLTLTLNTLALEYFLEWLKSWLVVFLLHLMLLVGQIHNLFSKTWTLHFLLMITKRIALLTQSRLIERPFLSALLLSKSSVVGLLLLTGNRWTRLGLS